MVRRNIEPKLVAILDKAVVNNEIYQKALKQKDARTIMVLAGHALIGVREKTGRNDGPMVELIQETIGGHSQEAWCMSFVQTLIAYAELKTGLVCPLVVSEGCDQVWTGTPKEHRVQRLPGPGAVIIWGHYNKLGHYKGGHTGIVIDYFPKEGVVVTIEGNTTHGLEDGKVVREGGGVYLNRRKITGDGDMKVRGYLKPFPLA